MKYGPFLLVFLMNCCCFGSVQAQNQVVIDTSNTPYRTALAADYTTRLLKTQQLINAVSERKVRKELTEEYDAKKEDFLALIKKGVFIEHPLYTPLIEKLVTTLQKANPQENFNNIRVLLAVSDEINAYNFGDGIIVIDLPLLIQIDNEYELAFIIAHEIAHQKLDHVYGSAVARSQFSNSAAMREKTRAIAKQKFSKGKLATALFKQIVYGNREESRKKEIEADALGYSYFIKAYPEFGAQSIAALAQLKNIDEEKDSLVATDYKAIFSKQKFQFRNELLSGESSTYNYQKSKFWNIDSLRTHPDCDERILLLKTKYKIEDVQNPVITPNFDKLRSDATQECIFGLYFIEAYGKSLYQTILALKKNPEDPFLRKMLHDNMIKLRDARNNYTSSKYLETENPKFTDSYNRFLIFMSNLRKSDFTQIIDAYQN